MQHIYKKIRFFTFSYCHHVIIFGEIIWSDFISGGETVTGDLHKKGSSITSEYYQYIQATETYSKTSQTPEMVLSIKTVQVFPPLTILSKISIVDIWQFSGCGSVMTFCKQEKKQRMTKAKNHAFLYNLLMFWRPLYPFHTTSPLLYPL